MFTKLEQCSWIKIEVAQGRSTLECFQGLLEACGDAVLLYHTVARWVKAFQEGRDIIQDNLHIGWPLRGEQHSSTPCFPVGCWSPMDCTWVRSRSQSMSQNCALNSARHSGLPQTCSALGTPWNFRGATMAPLCSRTGLVGLVPKGRDDFLGWIVTMVKPGLAHTNQTRNANQMNGRIPVLLIQRKCTLHIVL